MKAGRECDLMGRENRSGHNCRVQGSTESSAVYVDQVFFANAVKYADKDDPDKT